MEDQNSNGKTEKILWGNRTVVYKHLYVFNEPTPVWGGERRS